MTEPNHFGAGAKAIAPLVTRIPPERWETLALSARFRPAAIAERCGLSLRTVQRHFKKHYGTTLSEWLRKCRLQMAYERLRTGESIKSVAYGLGYKQLSHFSRDFKAAFGTAPKFLDHSALHHRQESLQIRDL